MAHCEKYYYINKELSDSSPTISLNLVKLLLYLNRAVLTGAYLTILGNQVPETRESTAVLNFT